MIQVNTVETVNTLLFKQKLSKTFGTKIQYARDIKNRIQVSKINIVLLHKSNTCLGPYESSMSIEILIYTVNNP